MVRTRAANRLFPPTLRSRLASARQTVHRMGYDDPLDLTKPRGKQDWQLSSFDLVPRNSVLADSRLERVAAKYSKDRWTRIWMDRAELEARSEENR